MPIPYCADIWLPGYVNNRLRARARRPGRVWLAITDHYEPFWQNRDEDLARRRVEEWRRKWPVIAQRHRDSQGRPAQYCFFYPEEEYRPALMDMLAEMTHAGFGDVEIHLHHDGEGEADFIDRMTRFRETLFERHGLLRKVDGRVVFGFIHGNWTLDNSHPQGRYCGLNNELLLLRDLGCYADFTMPCGPSPMQARMINTIYWAKDDPARPKSYDRGDVVAPGRAATGDLLMITGPFGLRWRGRWWKPRLEIGELASYDPPTAYRASRWLDLAPRIGDDIFVKLFSHGTQERHMACLLDGGLDVLFEAVASECRSRGHELRFATAWDMAQAAHHAAYFSSTPTTPE